MEGNDSHQRLFYVFYRHEFSPHQTLIDNLILSISGFLSCFLNIVNKFSSVLFFGDNYSLISSEIRPQHAQLQKPGHHYDWQRRQRHADAIQLELHVGQQDDFQRHLPARLQLQWRQRQSVDQGDGQWPGVDRSRRAAGTVWSQRFYSIIATDKMHPRNIFSIHHSFSHRRNKVEKSRRVCVMALTFNKMK
jgi:hypothetical protein